MNKDFELEWNYCFEALDLCLSRKNQRHWAALFGVNSLGWSEACCRLMKLEKVPQHCICKETCNSFGWQIHLQCKHLAYFPYESLWKLCSLWSGEIHSVIWKWETWLYYLVLDVTICFLNIIFLYRSTSISWKKQRSTTTGCWVLNRNYSFVIHLGANVPFYFAYFCRLMYSMMLILHLWCVSVQEVGFFFRMELGFTTN